jgi:phospholipid transport system transporter-binding protein
MKRAAEPASAESAAAVQRDGAIVVSGSITFDTVPGLFEQTRDWLENTGAPTSVDLRDVARADSAGLALLVEWLRLAKLHGRTLKFTNVPQQVHSLIRVNGLENALGVA